MAIKTVHFIIRELLSCGKSLEGLTNVIIMKINTIIIVLIVLYYYTIIIVL